MIGYIPQCMAAVASHYSAPVLKRWRMMAVGEKVHDGDQRFVPRRGWYYDSKSVGKVVTTRGTFRTKRPKP